MLSDITRPEKEVCATDPEQLRDLLETSFRTTYRQTTLDRIEFLPDGLVELEGEQLPCTPSFLEAAIDSIGMSQAYGFKVDIGLFRENFEQRKYPESKAVTVCINRGIAINLASAEYRPARTLDVLPGFVDETIWKFDGARLSDRGLEINYLQPGYAVEPSRGDIIELGIRLTNSETGYSGLKGSLSSLRLVCSNGAVMSDELGTARWNYDQRVAYSTSVEKFQKDVSKLGGQQDRQIRLYQGRLQRNLLDRAVVNVWRRLRTTLPAPKVDEVLDLRLETRQAIQAAVRQRPAGVPDEPTELNVWEIHNRITAAAQRFDFIRRARLERIGGGLLSDTSLN